MVGIRHVGVDCSETEHRMVLLSREGEWEARQVVSNEHGSIERGLQRLLARTQGESVRVVLEGLYGFSAPVAEVSRDLGLELWQANSVALDHYRDLEGQPRKDDDRDAFLLARMSYTKMEGCRLAMAPDPESQRLRRISRLHTRLTHTRGDAARRLRSRLVELSPEIVQKSWLGPKWSSRAFLAVMRRWHAVGGQRVPDGARFPNKRAFRITMKIPSSDRALVSWPKWARKRLEKQWYEALSESGGRKDGTWYLYFGTIPPDRFTKIDDLRG